jgi:hypothetical protein
MVYTRKQFIQDVTKEAVALKKHATKDELKHLNPFRIDPNDERACIYGQITGNCKSKRACELVFKCCTRYFEAGGSFNPTLGFSNAKQNVNGTSIEGVIDAEGLARDRVRMRHFSSIETYILLPSAKNKNLIDFLKGDRNDLKL